MPVAVDVPVPGRLLGRGHNRRIQENDPSVHGETDAFRKAGRQRSYRDKIMVTTLAPCWYCSGLVRQFGIGTVVVGEVPDPSADPVVVIGANGVLGGRILGVRPAMPGR